MRSRRGVLALALAASAGAAWPQAATPYPARPIRLVIGFAPGGAADYVARAMSDAFAKALGQSVLVDNKPGNGSSIAADLVAKSPADGYTLLIASPSSISVNPALNPKLTYTPSDLAPIARITTSPLVLAVNPATGIRSVAELIAAARKDPGKLNYSTSGNGSAPHLGAALFTQLTGAQMTHVPYRGGGPAIQSVMAGDTQLTFGTSPSVLPQANSGRLRAIAVSTRERSPLVPELPGMREAGLPEYNLEFWYGMFAPAGTPPAVLKKIYDATAAAMLEPSVKTALAREGTEVSLSASPEKFAEFLVEDGKFWVNLVKNAKVTVE
jgi:tripartite-type tricarboxylate transporter receptor subunit TctC